MSAVVPTLCLKNRTLHTTLPALVMTILNCTPDSFFSDSRFSFKNKTDLQKVTEYALQQFENGADIVDIGGESTRPGSKYVNEDEELERIIPLIHEIRKYTNGAISVDTRKSRVLKEALQAGADILNDVSALEDDLDLVNVVASEKIPVILMHKRNTPLTMQQNTVYNNLVADVSNYLSKRVMYASEHGIDGSKIIVDAGIGFAKQTKDNIVLIASSEQITEQVSSLSGVTIFGSLVGLSRKTCIGDITGHGVEKRLAGTLAANMIAVQNGARIIRVHDTIETIDMLKVMKDIDVNFRRENECV